jgi:hypothetical protein
MNMAGGEYGEPSPHFRLVYLARGVTLTQDHFGRASPPAAGGIGIGFDPPIEGEIDQFEDDYELERE